MLTILNLIFMIGKKKWKIDIIVFHIIIFKFKKKKKKKRKFFNRLILYSNLKKVIDITDKIISHEKFCTLKFNVYKNIGEFITLQKLLIFY